jgi:DUF1680 family protein
MILELPAPPTSRSNHTVEFVLNGKPQRQTPSDHWLIINRLWKPHDQVSVPAPIPAVPAQDVCKQ